MNPAKPELNLNIKTHDAHVAELVHQYPADLAAALDAMRARHIEPAEPAEYAEVLVD